jgi:hypothetical protein
MKSFSILAVAMAAALTAAGAETAVVRPFESPADLVPQGKIDELVFDRLQQLGIEPAHLCSDGVFVRRAYLDVIGTLPTGLEAWQFIQDRDPQKRRALVDRLLARKEFADYWAMKWSDLLRVKAEFPINLWPKAVNAYHRWIRTSIRENMPYDRFVRELLTASGSNFHVPQVNFYRAVQSREPKAIARAVALTFMGARAERWPPERLAGMAAFFSQIGYKATGEWKEEIVFNDLLKTAGAANKGANKGDSPIFAGSAAKIGTVPAAVFPDGTPARLSPERDPREDFADWLVTAENPWFARHIVNRVWYWLLGRGIVHEPDDIRPDNPARNPELLAYLGQELIASHYDLKHVYRLILTSQTYQLSSIARGDPLQAEAEFACYPLRRLDAEVLVDALCQITGSTEDYYSRTPEPYTIIPAQQRTIALADGSITSSFLEMFGRPPRDTGLESERSNGPTADQRLHLLNSSHIQSKIEKSVKLRSLAESGLDRRETVSRLYLLVLSRLPTADELAAARAYGQSGKVNAADGVLDLAWALVNSPEFLYRH